MKKYNYCPYCGFDIVYDEGEFKGEVMSHYCVNDEYITDII
jgi:hypothetical protein|tara:strand:- start:742 stop:864 length:123 start_codon:yes stop_codon:yes gene_type:complete